MEKPYRGLPYHNPKNRRAPARKASQPEETDWEEAEPLERAYPDGASPAECWGYEKAFSQKHPGGEDSCSET